MSIEKFNPRISGELVPYTQVNTYVIQNIKNLEAGFVWVYLLTLPKDWQVVKAHIKKKYKIGEDKLKRIFAFLRKTHLIEYVQERDSSGKMRKTDIRVLNGSKFQIQDVHTASVVVQPEAQIAQDAQTKPVEEPSNHADLEEVCTTGVETTPPENHTCGNQATTKNIDNKENKENKDKLLSASEDARDPNGLGFEDFWKIHPRKKNKIRAKREWDKKKYDRIATLICEDVANRLLNDPDWKDVQFVPHPDTYLRNQRWTDDITPKGATSKKQSSGSGFSDWLNNSDENGVLNKQAGVVHDGECFRV